MDFFPFLGLPMMQLVARAAQHRVLRHLRSRQSSSPACKATITPGVPGSTPGTACLQEKLEKTMENNGKMVKNEEKTIDSLRFFLRLT